MVKLRWVLYYTFKEILLSPFDALAWLTHRETIEVGGTVLGSRLLFELKAERVRDALARAKNLNTYVS